MSNFYLILFEEVDLLLDFVNPTKIELMAREQYWIDLLKPPYNILKKADNSLGFKHSEKTKKLLKGLATGRKHTAETKSLMSINRSG